ncbi:thioredoxin domain-containing protein 17-like isoform X1 [Hyposmocoma kahamanoa]|uniref:thioredoxin domain-containing protein 17-like isoform X1 n=1 Tax=Hyposmocoma kahamanoa TaxID=1477025 RepID=UPI000E6D76FD|nr:thioredoxin domain-containing protein 17-like isoform X1 [Hyposmocoma kahamanoa]
MNRAAPSKTLPHSVQTVNLKDYGTFSEYYNDVSNKSPPTFFCFTGTKKKGVNRWCRDFAEAEPVVKNVLNGIHKHVVFVFVDVGDREYWKNPQCPFRTDTRTKLMVIPTIIKWNGVQRLEGSQCNKAQLIEMMFEDE